MNNRILNSLCCPICGTSVEIANEGKSMVCLGENKKHCYDFSSGGYVNFASPSHNHSGDSKEAIRSRTDFLDKGFYSPIRDAVKETVHSYAGELWVDAGCGEGYYSDAVTDFGISLIGFDLSKHGVNAAAKRVFRRHMDHAFFAVAGIYSMPLVNSCADGVLSIFAPCAHEEFRRILKKDGVLVVVGAGKDHLLGLKKAIYDEAYINTERVDMPPDMPCIQEKNVYYTMTLNDSRDIMNLFSMTPYYYRTSEADREKLCALNHLETVVDVTVRVYRNV